MEEKPKFGKLFEENFLKPNIVFALFAVFVCMLSFSLLFLYLCYFESSKKNISSVYMISEFSPRTNKTIRGTVQINRRIGRDEYVTFGNNEGMFFTISIYFDMDYECRGSCFCHDEETERRIAFFTIRSGLYFVISALSIQMAVSVASNFFQDECSKQYGDSLCERGIVLSEVDECDTKELSKEAVGDYSIYDSIEKESKVYRYYCEGRCLGKRFSNNKAAEEYVEFVNCERYSFDAEIEVEINSKKAFGVRNSYAKFVFYRDFLNNFCKDLFRAPLIWNTREDKFIGSLGKILEKEQRGKRYYLISPCNARTNFGEWKNFKNVKCKKLN